MKKLIQFIFFLLIATSVTAQKSKHLTDTSALWQTYRHALEYNDLMVAKQALFALSAVEPENKSLLDSLAQIYFVLGAYPQAILAAEKANPSEALKEIRAYSYRNLGEIKTSLEIFEELYASSGSPENGYQVASMQFSLKRFGECEVTIEKILIHPDAVSKRVVITNDKGESQEVSYLAAAENLKGVMFIELGKTDMAKGCFERALASNPEFILAKNNLESITKPAVNK